MSLHPFIRRSRREQALIFILALLFTFSPRAADDRLPNTTLLDLQGDIASTLVAGVDRFLLSQLAASETNRAHYWHRDFSSAEAYEKSIATNRARLAHIIGARDRAMSSAPIRPDLFGRPIRIATTPKYTVSATRAVAFGDVTVEGLLLMPEKPVAAVIAIPDADVSPEQLAGIEPGVPVESQYARILAESGCAVAIPVLINRTVVQRRGAKLTNREFLYRSAFELGRHLVGYEVLKVRALVDAFQNDAKGKIGVIGWGEGGFIALCAGALDDRINATVVSGFFNDRRNVWQEPIDRNVFGLLDQFGDAEIASMIAPRALIVEAARGPEVTIKGEGGAPAKLGTPELASVRREFDRAKALISGLNPQPKFELTVSETGGGAYGTRETLTKFLGALAPAASYSNDASTPKILATIDAGARMTNQIHEIDQHNQWLLTESPFTRQAFMKNLDTSSPEKYATTSAQYRDFFYNEVIGRFDIKPLEPNPRSRLAYQKALWNGYEVVLDVFPDVIAYGVLLVPKNIQPGERRPVVVCQHGLEGRPQDVIEGNKEAYHDFAAKLAERGFVTFAPQNLYIFTDRFRTLQRKANPLGKTLFSIITPQHQQIVDWLKTLPYVDSTRIGFYGLSYGGKTAMRVPALVTDYAFSICSADFNEWVWKNASTRSPYSYVWGGEYEIFEFDLGSTFNYAEMAALIAPRPFMVERGHFDGVAPDETVAYEFAKVRFLYEARLKLPSDRCQIEWFVGPHTINGKGTYDFCHLHLNWPKPNP
ncbi:MAG TPA: dienelactone hydrolase family protein [Verrucomicrobiae bacterium]